MVSIRFGKYSIKLKTSKPYSYYFLTRNLAPTISFVRMCRIIFAESIVYLSFCTGIFYKQTFYSRFGRYYVNFLHDIKRVLNHLFLKHNEKKRWATEELLLCVFITNYQHYLSVWSKKKNNLLTLFCRSRLISMHCLCFFTSYPKMLLRFNTIRALL